MIANCPSTTLTPATNLRASATSEAANFANSSAERVLISSSESAREASRASTLAPSTRNSSTSPSGSSSSPASSGGSWKSARSSCSGVTLKFISVDVW
jgi:hypothetical protein